MEDTQEIVPIKTLNLILFDNNVFSKFIKNNDTKFYNNNTESIVKALNDYFNYLITNEPKLDKEIFDKMNYLNIYFKVDKSYYFSDYLDQTDKLINLNSLYQILANEKKYREFLEFDQTKFEFSQSEYIKALDDMVNYYKNNNIELNNIVTENYNRIKKMTTRLEGEIPTTLNNEEFQNKIFKDINMSNDKFTIARALYLNLANLVTYDVNFYALDQNINKPLPLEIYNKKPDQVSIENNNIVCKTWAELYCNLLKKIGLEAVVKGKFHKYVEFKVDDYIIKADAINTSRNSDELYSMNDIARVKLGIETAGFTSTDSIKQKLIDSDNKIKYDYKKLNQKVKFLEEKYVTVKKESYTKFESYREKLIMIDSMIRKQNVEGLEFCKFLKIVRELILSDEEKKLTKDIYAFRKKGRNYEAIIINAHLINDDYEYHIFSKDKGIEKFIYEELNLELLLGNIKLFKKEKEIPHKKEGYHVRF